MTAALAAKDAGWAGVKLKVGKPRVAEDVARVAAVRSAVGAELEIMVDANQSMTWTAAARRAAAFEALDVAWFEERCRPTTCRGTRSHAVVPEEPGVGIAWDLDAIDNRRVG